MRAYREHLAHLAEQPLLARAYERLDLDRLHRADDGAAGRRAIEDAAARARKRTSDRALPRFTEQHDGGLRLVEEPPLITRPDPAQYERIAVALDDYLQTLRPHWARILGGYRLVDVAHKVVGVGSVGLRAYIALCEGSSPDDVLFLQLKQARRSVVAPYVHGDSAWHAHQGAAGRRVPAGAADRQRPAARLDHGRRAPVLRAPVPRHEGRHRRRRHRRRGAGRLRRHLRAAARQGPCPHQRRLDDRRLPRPAATRPTRRSASSRSRYADQTERDHAALVAAVDRGLLPCERGV